jgi:cytoskeletal protein RodZ
MGELGTWLREAREAKNLSLSEVEAETRIRGSFIEALEEGDYDALPGEVHVRGFLRNYALHLGIDADEVRRKYEQEIPQRESVQYAQNESSFQPIDADLGRARGHLIAGLVYIGPILAVVAVGAAASIWLWYGRPLPEMPHWWPLQPQALLATAISPDSLTAPTSQAAGMSRPATSTAQPPEARQTPRPAPRLAATSQVLPLPTPTSVSRATGSPTPSAMPAAADEEGIRLTVRATDRAWTRITADGTIVFEAMLTTGDERTFEANVSMGFRCGNAGGVIITVNGQDLGALGKRGQVVDRTWIIEEERLSVVPTISP